MTSGTGLAQRVERVRRFNRFYTRQIGLLNQGLLRSPFSLTEVRLLYELAHRAEPTASELGQVLGLDPGYLSRLLRNFRKRGLIASKPSEADGRQTLLRLTAAGAKAFAGLDARSHQEIGALIRHLSSAEQHRLLAAMDAVALLLGDRPEREEVAKAPYLLRPHQPGDMGWVVHRHGVLYHHEYGWDERFEALVAGIVAEFIQQYDPKRERCWIAKRDAEIVGSVFLVSQSRTVARLRLLLVEPSARGLGIGKRLVRECTRFARQAGYRKITLWTNSLLHAARRIYQQEGYRLVHEEPHDKFGKNLVGQTWELQL